MTSTDRTTGARSELDDVAWEFLRSEFAGELYLDWPIDRRLDAFLRHRGYDQLHNDGTAYEALLDSVMANIGAALQTGVVPQQN